MKQLESLFKSYTGFPARAITELPSSGSNRRYFRIEGEHGTLIGTFGSCKEENKAFIAIAEHFRKQGLPVPEVYAHSRDFSCYLQQDLGDRILYNAVEEGRSRGNYNTREKKLLFKAMEALPALQFKGAEGLDFGVCYPQPEFDERMISFDLNYFKYCFLKATGLDFSEIKLEDDFRKLSSVLLRDASDTFLYRDFQARNVMLVSDEPYFIDFQGGRKGPIYYDVASFVWQAKANYSEELKEELISAYLKALRQYTPLDEKHFNRQLRHFILFRTLQVLGAYGFRGYFEKKPHFLQSVPYAIDNLRKLLKEPFTEYPYLSSLLLELTKMRQYSDMDKERKLQVTVCSFAYKKGIPNDSSGNGGGYVFDCRGLENPGQFEHFRHFTGEDQEVIRFMEEDGGVKGFLEHAYMLMDTHVQRYIERKFNHLMCCFGCTGGQHRSVYCARHMADYLAKKYDIRVHLYHRELDLEIDY
ncbi:MAG TPA: RNase adapter RapZ [Bacteroidales bacterium]|nr:MAG: glmZ(sRNA)-inactivating NTPase [Bacteroidetes bacterium ADurb.Bin139]HOG24880.1 RNase adapter RapZ [Bacteroidales bacterium]HOR10728.1 RNase adapter RapZ [Bacteroidales bacterium]HOZ18976.1 RNase adapter RapZ [Bacteroidales bacterium]HPB77689.1 RNase adapter RapZ [Bacteroidales bacterium]